MTTFQANRITLEPLAMKRTRYMAFEVRSLRKLSNLMGVEAVYTYIRLLISNTFRDHSLLKGKWACTFVQRFKVNELDILLVNFEKFEETLG